MADAQRTLDILLRTKATGDSKPVIKSLVDVKAGIDMVTAAYSQIAQSAAEAFDETVNKAVDYNLSIRNMAQNLGLATEETSRIVQAMDDFGVGSEQLETALALAVKNGFAPSIESIAQLADEYNSIQDPVERAAILTEKFGRNWSVLTPALREGGNAIREAAKSIDGSLIVTEDAAQAAEDYRRTLDELNDSVESLKINLGNWALPGVTAFVDLINDMGDLDGFRDGSDAAAKFLNNFFNLNKEFKNLGNVAPDMAERLRMVNAGIQETADVANEAQEAFSKLGFVISGEVTNDFDNYQDKQKELTEKLQGLQAELEKTSTRTPWKTDDITTLKGEIQNVNAALWENQSAWQASNKERLFGLIQDKLSATDMPKQEQANILMNIAEKMGLVGEKELALWKQTDDWVKRLGDAQLMAMNTKTAIDEIPDYKKVVIEIVTYGLRAAQRGVGSIGASGNPIAGERASGGPVSAGKAYIVGEEGPEVFVPGSSGNIVANRGKRQASAARPIVINGNVSVNAKDQTTFAQLMEEFAAQNGG